MQQSGKQKLSYHVVHWQVLTGNTVPDMQENIEAAHNTTSATDQRTFDHNYRQILGINYHNGLPEGSFLLHLTVYLHHEPTAVVPDPAPSVHVADPGEQSPPDGHSFLEGEAFALIRGNDIVFCGRPPATITVLRIYLTQMLQNTVSKTPFGIIDAPNVDKLKLLQTQGVQSLKVNSAISQAGLDIIDSQRSFTLIGKMKKAVLDVLREDTPDDQYLLDYENLLLSVELKLKKNGKVAITGDPIKIQGEKLLADNEAGMFSEGETFSIKTRSGQTITQSELRISKTVEISNRGNFIDRNDAWRALKVYYRELKKSGVLL